MEIRILAPAEGAVLKRVAEGVFDFVVDPQWSQAFLADPSHALAVALDDGVVVGMVSTVRYVHPDKAPQLWINEVAVAPAHQGRGIGKLLMEAALENGRAMGCTEAWVGTETTNAIARRLYASTGGVEDPLGFVVYTFSLGPGG